MTSQRVSLDICNKCRNENVKPLDIKDIMEAILSEKNNISRVRRVTNILICDYLANGRSSSNKKVGGIEFVEYSLKAKPNTKNPLMIELKQTITNWLDEVSTEYRRRKSREATANNYYKSVLKYIVLIIVKVSH